MAKWTPERVNQLKALNDQRLSNDEIGRILGLSVHSVAMTKHRLGIRHKKQWTTTDLLLIRRLREEGFTSSEIAQKLGVTRDSISLQIYSYDLIPSRQYNPKPDSIDYTRLSPYRLAKTFNLSPRCVRIWISRGHLIATKESGQHLINLANFYHFVTQYRDRYGSLQSIDIPPTKIKEFNHV